MFDPDITVSYNFKNNAGISNAFSGVKSKICHLKGMETLPEKTPDEAVGKTGNAKIMTTCSSQSQNFVYTRRKRRNSVSTQENCSAVESPECDKNKLVTSQMRTAKDTVPPSKTIETINNKLCEPDNSAGLILGISQAHGEVPDVQSNLAELNPSSQNPNTFSCENKCSGDKEAQLISEPMVQRNQELKNNLNSNVKFVGSYMHPMPVSSLLLRTREDEIHICVLCGLLTGQHRTLFTYKVAIKEPNFGCPSVMAHTPIMLPDPKYNSMREVSCFSFSVLKPLFPYLHFTQTSGYINAYSQNISYCLLEYVGKNWGGVDS